MLLYLNNLCGYLEVQKPNLGVDIFTGYTDTNSVSNELYQFELSENNTISKCIPHKIPNTPKRCTFE